MRCIVLTDNNTYIDHYYLGEPGFSIYIENGEDHILLDTGYSDVFIQNAEKLGIDLSKVNMIVLSHGHNDHTGGLIAFDQKYGLGNVTIIAHPDVFQQKAHLGLEVGSPMTEAEVRSKAKALQLIRKPEQISPNLYFLGEIQTVEEERCAVGTSNDLPDYLYDDTALAYLGRQGITIMSGCSHSGICNITEQSIRILGDHPIHRIIGGFHLFDVDSRLKQTVRYLKKKDIMHLCPCHCVSLKAKIQLAKEMEIEEVGVSMTFEDL